MDKEDLRKVIDLIEESSGFFEQEGPRRAKNKVQYDVPQWSKLIEEYEKDFARPFEATRSNMYLDSSGFITVGCGHLLGYSWKRFWDNVAVKTLMSKLKKEADSQVLWTKDRFKSINTPEDVKSFFSIPVNSEFLDIFKIRCIRDSILEANSLPFKVVLKENEVSEKDVIINACIELVVISILLEFRIQYLKDHLIYIKRFLGRNFNINKVKSNRPILGDTEIGNLLNTDITNKIAFLDRESKIKGFRQLPFNVQKGTLDLAFTATPDPDHWMGLINEKKWKELSNKSYDFGRNDEFYGDRNQKVRDLFATVA